MLFARFLISILCYLSVGSALGSTSLRILVWEGYAPEGAIVKFKQSLGKDEKDIEIKVSYAEESDEFFNALRANTADVICLPHNLIKSEKFAFIENKLVLALDETQLPNYRKVISAFQQAEYGQHMKKLYATPIAHGPYGLAYNTNLVKVAPTSWDVLFKKENQGQYAISGDQYEANIFTIAVAMGIPRDRLSDLSALNTPEFHNKLRQFAKGAGRKWIAVDGAKDLQGMKYAVAWGDSFSDLAQAGETWRFADPKEGTTGWLDYMLVNSKVAKNPALRRLSHQWLDFTLSDWFQLNAIVREMGNGPINKDIGNQLTSDERKKFKFDDPEYFQRQRILWATLDKRTQNGFKLMWENASR